MIHNPLSFAMCVRVRVCVRVCVYMHVQLTWYVENQALIDAQANELKQQRVLNKQLSEALRGKKSEKPGSAPIEEGEGGRQGLVLKEQRIRSLEAQLKRLTELNQKLAQGMASKRGGVASSAYIIFSRAF